MPFDLFTLVFLQPKTIDYHDMFFSMILLIANYNAFVLGHCQINVWQYGLYWDSEYKMECGFSDIFICSNNFVW